MLNPCSPAMHTVRHSTVVATVTAVTDRVPGVPAIVEEDEACSGVPLMPSYSKTPTHPGELAAQVKLAVCSVPVAILYQR